MSLCHHNQGATYKRERDYSFKLSFHHTHVVNARCWDGKLMFKQGFKTHLAKMKCLGKLVVVSKSAVGCLDQPFSSLDGWFGQVERSIRPGK